jgi:acetyl-CoA decarbonylase/synthase complex subunit gamma
MKLAQRQASVDLCPDISEEAKAKLGEASAPPVRPITVGAGDHPVKMGEETVLFRHEKKFVNPCCLAIEVKDTRSDAEITALVDGVLSSEMDRVGQKLRLDALYLNNESGDAAKFEALVKAVAAKAGGVPVILATRNAAAAEAALKVVAAKRPILYGADASNAEAFAALAKTYKAILGVTAKGLEALSDLTEKIKALGVEDMVIDPQATTAKEMIEVQTLARRAAIKKNFKPLGYPVMMFAQRPDPMLETLVAAVGIAKYASIIVLDGIEKWRNLALFTMRQNIYTDPQVPMQVEQKVYKIGEPVTESPLFITTNFSLTYFIVSGEIENSKVASRLAVLDCEGLSVLTAWAAGKFTAGKIAQFILESGLENEVSHKELIIPGYVAILSGALEEKLPGWTITVGPREANALPAFLKARNN